MKTAAIYILLLLFVYLSPLPCFAQSNLDLIDGFSLEIRAENNSFPVWFIFVGITEETAGSEKIRASEQLLSKSNLSCSLPLWRRETSSLGVFFQKATFTRITGQTLQFYQDYTDSTFLPVEKYYDLGGDFINYSLLGTYASHRWNNDPLALSLRGALFTCYNYQQVNAIGQGWIKRRISGSKYYEIFGDYKEERIDTDHPWGWGVSLSWATSLEKDDLSLSLSLQNLPGWIYLPKLTQENGKVDSKKDSIGPLPIEGFCFRSAS